MAGQGIESGPREAAWVIKPRERSEFLFRRCHDCGEIRSEPSHGVIRVNDEQFSEFCRIRKSRRGWDAGIPLSIVGCIAVVFSTFFGTAFLVDPVPTTKAFLLMSAGSVIVGAVTYFLTTHQMFRYNRRFIEEQREKEGKFLKPMTGLDPHQVGTPELVGCRRIRAVLVPEGIYDELSYVEYLD